MGTPVDDDEGDDQYANLLAKVRENYEPQHMPSPMDLEHPPTKMPEDLTAIGDLEQRRLHSQFNALSARARYLYNIESAKGRACERIYRYHLKGAMRPARETLGKDATLTEVQQLAEENEIVAKWIVRRDDHQERAEAYKTYLAMYSENVTVLSRDWTMRAREESGS